MHNGQPKLAFISYNAEPIIGRQIPDEDGYYKLRSGKLNTKSRQGVFYSGSQQVRNLFSPSSRFVERIKDGEIFGEASHPRNEGMTPMAYKQRLATIEPDQTAFFVKGVELIENRVGEYEIWLTIKPTGIYGNAFKEALDDEFMNVSLSLRGFSKTVSGIRTLIYIVTFDWVHSPGIELSSKRAIANEPTRNWVKEAEQLDDVLIEVDDVVEQLENVGFALENEHSNQCLGDICTVVKENFAVENEQLVDVSKSIFSWYK